MRSLHICDSGSTPPSPMKKTAARRSYHHGNLRRALLDAALRLAEEEGVENITVRAVAKMTGVSPGAPFRHFPSRTALLTAIAEEAMDGLVEGIEHAMISSRDENPVMRYRAIGIAFLTWALQNPIHFKVLSARDSIEYEQPSLRGRNDKIRDSMTQLLTEAKAKGLVGAGDPARYSVAGRAMAYGLARMYLDGHFPSWNLKSADPLREGIAVIDIYISSISTSK